MGDRGSEVSKVSEVWVGEVLTMHARPAFLSEKRCANSLSLLGWWEGPLWIRLFA